MVGKPDMHLVRTMAWVLIAKGLPIIAAARLGSARSVTGKAGSRDARTDPIGLPRVLRRAGTRGYAETVGDPGPGFSWSGRQRISGNRPVGRCDRRTTAFAVVSHVDFGQGSNAITPETQAPAPRRRGMKSMRIVVHGQDAFGKAVLERLLERGENVVAVCCAPDKAGRPEDPLKVLAREKGLPVHQPKSWKTPEALELMQSFDADVCMMAYVLLFVPQPVLDAPRLGTFQYHPSLLPAHRGPSSINWPIAMGKTRTGLTIFWPDEGLDEGPVLLQKTVEIGPDDTLGDVYFKKLFPLGVDAMMESLDLVKAGVLLKHVQRLEDGSYESWFKKDLAELDWQKPAGEVYNTIRAANPAPGAWTMLAGVKLDIYDAARASAEGRPGEVVAIDETGFTIAAGGGGVLVKRVRAPGGQKIAAIEWAKSVGLTLGSTCERAAG
jgi:methionyl-tRNA formyltransferase